MKHRNSQKSTEIRGNPWRRVETVPRGDDFTYYSIYELAGDGMAALREIFPDGQANPLNFVLFSTSGVHGCYSTIEDVEDDELPSVTFLVVQPRVVCLRFGNVSPAGAEDIAFLKQLRRSSTEVVSRIGYPVPAEPGSSAESPVIEEHCESEGEPDVG